MKTLITIFISLLFFAACFAQQDLFPAFPSEIIYKEDIAYFNGSPFTGILVDEKTNKKMGEFNNGYRNGMFAEYFNNGKKKSEGNYVNGVKVGRHTQWFSNGQQNLFYNYNSGNLTDGKYTIYLENGQIEREQNFSNGNLTNEVFYENGKIVKTKNRIIEFHPNGIMKFVGYTINYKKEGVWARWYDTGKKEEEATYENGILNGKYNTWYENDQKRSEGTYLNGVINGIWTYWYDNGRVKSKENDKDGKKDEKFIRNNKKGEASNSKLPKAGKR